MAIDGMATARSEERAKVVSDDAGHRIVPQVDETRGLYCIDAPQDQWICVPVYI